MRNLFGDALYRGSLILITNTVATAVIGFAFWSLAAHRYPASAVGVFSSVTSGAGLLAVIAALGLPNVDHPPHYERAECARTDNRGRHGHRHGRHRAMSCHRAGARPPPARLAGPSSAGRDGAPGDHSGDFTAVGTILDVGLVATRSSHDVLIKNLAGSIVRVVAMLLLVSFPIIGAADRLQPGAGADRRARRCFLNRQVKAKRARFGAFRVLRSHLSITSGNYVATVMGILPASVVPLQVLVVLGAAETGQFAIAFLI